MTSAEGSLTREVNDIYAQLPHHILPFVGERFENPSATSMRVMTMGINSYVSAQDWKPDEGRPEPTLFRDWYRNETYRFFRAVRKKATALADALAEQSTMFSKLERPEWPDGFYGTNAVKVFLREEGGKRAEQLREDVYTRHVKQWHDELDRMARFDALPHLILVFGKPFWGHAHSAFSDRDPEFTSITRSEIEPARGESLHFANRVRLSVRGVDHELLLIRIRHPAARTAKGSVEWLLAQEDFRRLAALPAVHHGSTAASQG